MPPLYLLEAGSQEVTFFLYLKRCKQTEPTYRTSSIQFRFTIGDQAGHSSFSKNGGLIGQRVWGLADLNERTPLTAQTQMPICAMTKQIFCALLLDLQTHPPSAIAAEGDIHKQLLEALAQLLPPEMTHGTGLTQS